MSHTATSTVAMNAEAAVLIDLYDERCRLAARDNSTGAMLDEVLAKGRELDHACDFFRRRYFPRRASVFVGLWCVHVASPSRRRIDVVLDLFEQYQ